MAQIDRRTFLRGAVATAGAAAFGGPFAGFASDALAASSKPSFRGLRPIPDQRDGMVREFEYQVRQRDGGILWLSDSATSVRDESGEVVRYELPNLSALNFVMDQALGGGVTRSLALDAHGKSLSSALLDLDIVPPPDDK